MALTFSLVQEITPRETNFLPQFFRIIFMAKIHNENFFTQATHLEKSTRPIFQCRLCPVTVISTAVLERHVRVVHENQRNFPCTFCNRRFGSSYDLRRHVTARHPPNQEEIHACDKCEYQSHLKCRLDRHLRVHNDDEKLGCYFCGKTFVHFYRLVIHCRGLHLLEK